MRLGPYFESLGVSSSSGRTCERSHKLVSESYADPSSVRVASSSASPGDVHVKCKCFRSQKKTSKPYEVDVVLGPGGTVTKATCQCPAGKSGACSHSRAALNLLALLKQQGYTEPPPELSCTELPQQWRRPRSTPLAPMPVEFVDWRSVRQEGLTEPIYSKFYDARGLEITPADAAALEQNTRRQANSETWKEARSQRVTASSFGVVLKRPTWTDKGLQNFTSQKDLSRVRPIQYGISNEQPAVHRYVSVMKTRGHDVEAFRCGLVVDPSCPWLGASPDRLIFDPSETPMHGLLEVKCPYSQKGKSVSQIEEAFYMVKDHQGIFRLDRSHDYYFQVLGQMALAGLSWTDFAVFSDQFMIVERIRFCEQDWAVARPKLDNFFFSVLLPYLAK
ncbi:uncharacterized protein LOC144148223 [Haemaphysalis longicornis]